MDLGKKSRIYKNYIEVEREIWGQRFHELNLQGTDDIIIFGCGMWGKALYERLGNIAQVVGFADNNKKMQGQKIMECPVYSPEECVLKYPQAVYVIAIDKFFEEINRQLILLGINEGKIRRLNTYDSGMTTRKYFSERLNNQYYVDETVPFEGFIPAVKSHLQEDRRDFRVYLEEGLARTLDEGMDPFACQVMDEYEKDYGTYRDVGCISTQGAGTSKVRILIACSHKDLAGLSDDNEEFYVPVQVGKALTDVCMYEVCDNTGDHISDRNYNYCECTALYWAWKNGFAKDADYVGLRHYRRKFDISDEQLRHLKENHIDIIHLDPIYHDNIRNSFVHHTKKAEDWELMKKVIQDKFPEFYDTMLVYESQHFICAYNMSIMRRDLFDRYCEFLFGVLLEIENYYLERCDRRDRYLGYLAENLTSIFIMHVKDQAKNVIAKLLPIITPR